MVFMAADKPGGGDSELQKEEPAASTAVDHKAKLLALLGLDETADEAAIDAKIAEVSTTLGGVGELQTKASSAEELQRQLDDISGKYAELNKQQEALWKQKQEAEADEILKVYEGHFVDDQSKAAIRNILLNDKDAGIAILNGLKKPDAAAPEVDKEKKADVPPGPDHDPNAAEPTAAEKAAESEKLIAAIQAQGKFPEYTEAREEARRQKPELFS